MRRKAAAIGAAAGLVNGLLGAGGGMVAVSLLRRAGLDPKRAHATSVAVILPLSALSAAVYWLAGRVALSDALPYLPWGMAGALLGSYLLRRIPSGLLRRLFGGLLLFAAVRLLLP